MFASCGDDEWSGEKGINPEGQATEAIDVGAIKESESISSTENLNERKVSTIKIGNLEVMTEDLGEMNWDDAKKACKNLGDGWRLPTKDELNLLYENKEKIGGFAINYYWSSTEYDNGDAWYQSFPNGHQDNVFKNLANYVRAVRAF